MFPDWSDPLGPLNPNAALYWAEWICPNCGEDGIAAELDDEQQCPNCGSTAENA